VSTQHAVAAARRGDLRAWEWIVRTHQELVFRSAYLTTRDSALAERTTQDVLVRAYRSLGSLDEGADLRPWLLRLTDTAARARVREQSRRRDSRMPEPEPIPRTRATPVRLGPGMPRPSTIEHAAMVDAFDRLLEDERATIAARYAFALDRDGAATRIGVKPEVLDERLASAMALLRRRVGEIMATAPDPDTRASGPGRIGALADDELGPMAMAAVISELPWTPDVSRLACERLAREAVAYPEVSTLADAPVFSVDRRRRSAAR
jgi:RNA polymerase sigma-70 factor (ECF subfamily)